MTEEASTSALQTFTQKGLQSNPRTSLESIAQADVSVKVLLSGGIAGAVSKTMTAPFGRLTILYQTGGFRSLGAYPRIDSAFLHVVRNEGVCSLWRGNVATILHRLPYSAASFMTYEHALSFLQRSLPKEDNVVSGNIDLARRFLAGAAAGSVSTMVAYPIDLVRTRLAAQTSRDYRGIWDVLKRTYLEETASGLYKGLGGSLVQVVPNVAINLCTYETMRSYWIAHRSENESPGFVGSVACGAVAGFVSSTLTYPLDLIRRQMQLQGLHGKQRSYRSYADAIEKTWSKGRFRAFYIGILAEYLKVVPGVSIIYAMYELNKKSLGIDGYNAGRR